MKVKDKNSENNYNNLSMDMHDKNKIVTKNGGGSNNYRSILQNHVSEHKTSVNKFKKTYIKHLFRPQ